MYEHQYEHLTIFPVLINLTQKLMQLHVYMTYIKGTNERAFNLDFHHVETIASEKAIITPAYSVLITCTFMLVRILVRSNALISFKVWPECKL